MFCPKCGAADQNTDSYCKRCGEWLPDMSHLGRRHGRLKARTPEQRNRKMRVLESISALMALSSAIIIFLVLAGKLDKDLLNLAAQLCICTAIFQAVNFAIGRSLQKRLKQGRGSSSDDGRAISFAVTEDAPQLNQGDAGQFIPAPSVTENTTAILEPAVRITEQSKSSRK